MIDVKIPVPNARADEFIYMVSHDIRAAARALSEIPSWIQEDIDAANLDLPEEVHENLTLLSQQSRRLDRMLKDILTFSRVGRSCELTQIDLGLAYAAALDITDLRKAATAVPIQIEYESASALLNIDPLEAKLIFAALISNTVKHCQHPQPELKIWQETEGEFLVLNFLDNGTGIPPDQVAKMFKPMTTMKSRDLVEGSGMGLAIVQKIVTSNGGFTRAGILDGGPGFLVRLGFPTQSDQRSLSI